MQYVLAVYRSRTVAFRSYRSLLDRGVTCALVSTPRSAGAGCGLSVKLSSADWPGVRPLLENETLVGFFLYRSTLYGGTLTRL